MNQENFEALESWFKTYVSHYASEENKLHLILAMKMDHSARVADECRDIARDLGWSPNDTRAAYALGLLHDIGRFEQFTKFGTLIDQLSVDHGEQGHEELRRSDALAAFEAAEKELILNGVRYHNRRFIPETVSGEATRFVKLIRDADKLDILFVLQDAIRKGTHKLQPEILFNIDLNGPPNPDLVKQALLSHSGSYEHVRSLADLNILRVTWVYDINYLPTLRRILERKLLDGLVETMSCSPTDQIMQIVGDARQYIQRKISEANPNLK